MSNLKTTFNETPTKLGSFLFAVTALKKLFFTWPIYQFWRNTKQIKCERAECEMRCLGCDGKVSLSFWATDSIRCILGKPNCVFRKNVIKLNVILVLVLVVVGVGVLVLQSFLDFVCGNQNVCSLDAVVKTMPLAE